MHFFTLTVRHTLPLKCAWWQLFVPGEELENKKADCPRESSHEHLGRGSVFALAGQIITNWGLFHSSSSRLLFPIFFLMHWDEAMEVQQLILCWLRKIGVGHRWNKKLFLLPQNKSHGAHRAKPGCLSWFTSEDWSVLAKFSLNIPGWFSGLTCWKPAELKGEGHLGTSENVML